MCARLCHGTCVEARRQLEEVSFLLPPCGLELRWSFWAASCWTCWVSHCSAPAFKKESQSRWPMASTEDRKTCVWAEHADYLWTEIRGNNRGHRDSDLVITCEATGAINSGFHIESRLGFRPCPCVAGTSLDSRETGVMFICVTDRSRQADPS